MKLKLTPKEIIQIIDLIEREMEILIPNCILYNDLKELKNKLIDQKAAQC